MKNLIKYKQGMRSKIVFTLKRIQKENSNWLELFQGESGSGKTWSAIRDCYERDPDFNVSKQLVFDFRSFMSLINSDWFKEKKIKQIVFDEPQTAISNRQWQSLANKLFNYLLTTFRHQNCIVLFCCPYRDFLDSSSMKMIHCITEMHRIDIKKGLVKTRPKLQQYNSKLKKTYEHSIYVLRRGRPNKMMFDYIPKPPKELIDIYERMKTDFTTSLNKDIENQLTKLEKGKEEPDKPEPIHTLKAHELELYEYIKDNPNKYQKDIAEELNLTSKIVSTRIKMIEKKGINIRKYLRKHAYTKNLRNYRGKPQQTPIDLTYKGSDIKNKSQ